MENMIVSTAYAPLQPPYQVIKYDQDVAMQIGTLIVTVQKKANKGVSDYQIETHSHPVVAYENKLNKEMTNAQLTRHEFLEGAVWNNVEVRDVTTVCLAGAILTWQEYLDVLEYESLLHCYRQIPDVNLYWRLKKLGVKVLPPEERECTIYLTMMLQPEQAGLSIQAYQDQLLFLNVSVAEDKMDKGHVAYNKEEGIWTSDVWKEESQILHELTVQLHAYRHVLRDLLFDQEVNHFTVTYFTNDDRLQRIVEQLNSTDHFVNLTFVC